MHAYEDAVVGTDLAEHEGDMLVLVDVVAIADDAPVSKLRRQPGFGNAMDEALCLQPVRDDLCDGDEGETVFLRELLQLGPTSARSILAEDLADHARRTEPGQTREVNRCFGVPDPLQHTTVARAKRWYVTRTAEIGRNCFWIDCYANRFGAILRADASRHAKAFVRINADRECRTVLVGADFALRIQLQLVRLLVSQRQTNPSTGLLDHEV